MTITNRETIRADEDYLLHPGYQPVSKNPDEIIVARNGNPLATSLTYSVFVAAYTVLLATGYGIAAWSLFAVFVVYRFFREKRYPEYDIKRTDKKKTVAGFSILIVATIPLFWVISGMPDFRTGGTEPLTLAKILTVLGCSITLSIASYCFIPHNYAEPRSSFLPAAAEHPVDNQEGGVRP